MRVGILGATEAQSNGAAVDLGTRKQQALLAALAMHRGRPVPPDTIVDLLWGTRRIPKSPPPQRSHHSPFETHSTDLVLAS